MIDLRQHHQHDYQKVVELYLSKETHQHSDGSCRLTINTQHPQTFDVIHRVISVTVFHDFYQYDVNYIYSHCCYEQLTVNFNTRV